MRVGFLSRHNPADPGALSGMPYSAWTALEAAGAELVDLSGSDPGPVVRPPRAGGLRGMARRMGLGHRWRRVKVRATEIALQPWDYERTIREAAQHSALAQSLLDEAANLDVLFGVCTADVLYRLKTDIPIVYTSDTTARLINASYPDRLRRSKAYHRASEEIEHTALHACSVFAPPARSTAQSAIDDYGVDPARVRVIEMGAHVVPDGMPLDFSPPDRTHIELVLVAGDPKRKRLGLCIEVVKELRERGWNATLNFVGAHDPVLNGAESMVNWAGRLMLNDPADREKHKQLLRQSHWMILPSLGEAFGIAPAESAHFGRPSIVTDVGGLPTVVQHGETGVVVPVDAPASVYADALIEYSGDPARYAAMSEAALNRAEGVLSWSAWARRMMEVFEELTARQEA